MSDAPRPDDDVVVLSTFTRGRRFPQMIGRLPGGIRIPFVVSVFQFSLFCGSLAVLVATRGIWAHLGALGDGLVLMGIPTGLAIATRAVRVQGRGPARFLIGVARAFTAPRGGRMRGRVRRATKPLVLSGRVITDDRTDSVAEPTVRRAPVAVARAAPTVAGLVAVARGDAGRRSEVG